MTNIIDQFKINGKVAIVTGGAMGLGKAMAEALAQAGADIVIADIKLDLAQETANAIAEHEGVKTTALKVDVTNPCLLYTSPSPRDQRGSRMPSSA